MCTLLTCWHSNAKNTLFSLLVIITVNGCQLLQAITHCFLSTNPRKTCLANEAPLVVGLWCNPIQQTETLYEKWKPCWITQNTNESNQSNTHTCTTTHTHTHTFSGMCTNMCWHGASDTETNFMKFNLDVFPQQCTGSWKPTRRTVQAQFNANNTDYWNNVPILFLHQIKGMLFPFNILVTYVRKMF